MSPLRAALVLLAALSSPLAAQDYPSKPVHVYVPSSPGGASDIAARLVSPKLAEALGQPFVVENRVASGGIVGTAQLAKAPADGYAIMMTFDTFASNPHLYKELPYDVAVDLADRAGGRQGGGLRVAVARGDHHAFHAQRTLFGPTRRRVPRMIDLTNPVLLGPVLNQHDFATGPDGPRISSQLFRRDAAIPHAQRG